ncbi:MAG: hypothetical protein Tsb0034_13380 [Ekhidna sp.]
MNVAFLHETRKVYIPLLRLLLPLVVIKEVWTIRNKQLGYFELDHAFYDSNALTDFLFHFLDTNNFVYLIIITFGLFASIGLFTRFTLFIFSLTSLFVFYFENSFGIYNHEAGLSLQILFVLALCPGTENWSIDNVFFNRVPVSHFFTVSTYHNWGVKLILTLLVIGYTTAGVSKIRYGGVDWLNGETLSFYLSGQASFRGEPAQKFIPQTTNVDWKEENALKAYTYGNFQTNETLLQIGQKISKSKLVMVGLSVFTVLFEVMAFLLLVNKPLRTIFLFTAIMFHLGIRFLMGLGFLDYQVICISMIDWNYVSGKVAILKKGITG